MSGNEIAVIEADNYPLDENGLLLGSSRKATKAEATKITKELRTAAEEFAERVGEAKDAEADIKAICEQAFDMNVHVVLGYSDFTAWYTDNAGSIIGQALDADTRKEIAKTLNSKGVSLRAIAKGLGVSGATISRALKDVEKPDKVIGVDGKEQSGKSKAGGRKANTDESDIIDAETVEVEAETDTKVKQLPPAFAVAVQQLSAVAATLTALSEDSRFKRATKKFADEHGDSILVSVNSVLDLCDKLGLQVFATDEAIEEFIEAETEPVAEVETIEELDSLEDAAAVDDSMLATEDDDEEF